MKDPHSTAGHASILALVLGLGMAMVVIGSLTTRAGHALGGPATLDIATPTATATHPTATHPTAPDPTAIDPDDVRAVIDEYCVRCHNERRMTGGLALDVLDVE